MELLATQPSWFPGSEEQRFYLSELASLEELADIKPTDEHFVLFVAADARDKSQEVLTPLLMRLVDRGLAYCCCWGPEATRLETAFDLAYIASGAGSVDADTEEVLLTSSHEDESLQEALWFFTHLTFPTERYQRGCHTWIAAVVNDSGWADEIRRLIPEVLKPLSDN